jgi:hypothetical protein
LSLILWQPYTEGVREQCAEGIFDPKREEGAENWRKLHRMGLRHFYYSQNIIRIIKTRRM